MEHCKKCGPCDGAMGTLCGMNRCGGHYGLVLLRWFLGLVIILLVFSLGAKVGFYKAIIESGYGYDGGYGYHGRMMDGYGYRGMIYLNQAGASDTAKAAPTKK